MSVLDQERVDTIKKILKWNPRGLTISDIASKTNMTRNIVAKYLDILLISGQVEMQVVGAAKVYFLSHRVPIAAMLDFSSDVVIVLDSDHRILKINEPGLVLLQENRESVVGTNMNETKNPFLLALRSHLPSKGTRMTSPQISKMNCILEEKEFHFRMKQIPAVFEDGGRGITLIIEDITAQYASQESMRMSEARYRGIVEDQTEFIVRFLPGGNLTFVNEAYARYSEKKREELIGQPYIPGIHKEDTPDVDRAVRSLNRAHPVTAFECRIRHPSGQTRRNAWTVRALYDKSGELTEYQGVGRDNTDKIEAAAKINKYIRNMEFLAQTSIAFRDMPEEENIFDYVAREVYNLAPGFLVWVGIFDEPNRRLVIKSVVGNPIALDTMQQLTGMRVADMTFPMDVADTAALIQHRKLVKAPPLFRLLHMQVPEEICRAIEKAAWGIDTYLMGLISKGKIIGDVGISIQSGSELPNRDLIEAFIRQAAIAIDRKIADDDLRQSLSRERDQVRNLVFLSRTAMDFIEMKDSADIYQYIGDRLHELVPESIIGVSSFNPEHRELVFRAVSGEKTRIDEFWKILGINPLGMSFPASLLPHAEEEFSTNTLFEAPSLYQLFFQQIPKEHCIRAEETIVPGKGFGMGFCCGGGIFGSVLIKLTRPGDIANREIVEAFVHQASVALLRRYARERHRESEERFQLLVEQTPYPLVILDQDGCVLAANGHASDLVGCCEAEGLSGKSFGEYIEGDSDPFTALIQDLMQKEASDLTCRLLLRSQGEGTNEVEVWGRTVHYDRKPALFMTLRPL